MVAAISWTKAVVESQRGTDVFRIKICGITSIEDARVVVDAGADAIGLNFYDQSQRYVELPLAQQLVEVVPGHVVKVGVFVNASSDEVCSTFDRLTLDLIQLHGDESPEFLAELKDRPVMRAFRIDQRKLNHVMEYLDQCHRLNCSPRMVLMDASEPGQFGGTGKLTHWPTVASVQDRLGDIPLVLAGGLDAENVGEAISAVRPHAVDSASGVEDQPGKKDAHRVAAFVEAAKAAFASP